jgi:hypothetical protein
MKIFLLNYFFSQISLFCSFFLFVHFICFSFVLVVAWHCFSFGQTVERALTELFYTFILIMQNEVLRLQ